MELYRVCGIQEYWLVDSDKETLQIYWFENGEIADQFLYKRPHDEIAESAHFQTLQVNLADVFGD